LAGPIWIVQIIVAIGLMILILLQARGEGFNASFSSDSSIFRTRRGFEKTLFYFTIAASIFFVIISIASVLAQ
jgi:preprotein translocase subunit SecG